MQAACIGFTATLQSARSCHPMQVCQYFSRARKPLKHESSALRGRCSYAQASKLDPTFRVSRLQLNGLQVCNHPDLFEGRPIVSAFDFPGLELRLPSIVTRAVEPDACKDINFSTLQLIPCQHEGMSQWEAQTTKVRFSSLPVLSAHMSQS